MANWQTLITEALTEREESWDDVVSHTLSIEELDQEFNNGYGGSQGVPFTLWTKKRVYFPAVYDGAEWVESAPLNPLSEEKTRHIGGE